MNTMYFSGADVIISIKDIALTDVSYIQIVPQQPVLPVYSVYSDVPTVVLRGKFSVRGTLAFNLAYSQPFEHLVRYFEEQLRQAGHTGKQDSLTVPPITKFGENLYYVRELAVTLRNEQPTGHVPKIVLKHLYLTGGTVNAIQDGNPLQDVYSFTALKMDRMDSVQTYEV